VAQDQEGTAGKGNELTGIRALLDMLVLKGGIVTMDALGCQTDVSEKIVAQGGDYALAVKNNQKNLSQAIVAFFDTAAALDFRHNYVQQRDLTKRDRGRFETRRSAFVANDSWMDKPMREGWKKQTGCRRHD